MSREQVALAPVGPGRDNSDVTGMTDDHWGIMIATETTPMTRRWHAVFCKPQQDERAEMHLRNQGFEIFRPKTRQQRNCNGQRRTRIESMFPRYLFIRLSVSGQDWAPIRSTRGAIGLVRHGQQAAQVPEGIIEDLQRRCDENAVINLSGQIDYRVDEPVEIIDGPCAGYQALFQARTGAERVSVLLTLLNSQRVVEIADSAIRRA